MQILKCKVCSFRTTEIKFLVEHYKTHPGKSISMIEFDKTENDEEGSFYQKQVDKRLIVIGGVIEAVLARISKVEKDILKITGQAALSREQQKKLYVLIRKYSEQVGDTEEDAKSQLKLMFFGDNWKTISFSSISKEQAHGFIDYVVTQIIENNGAITEADLMFYEKTELFVKKMVEKKMCMICGQPGETSQYNSKQFSLCPGHIEEWKAGKDEFITKYIFNDYFGVYK